MAFGSENGSILFVSMADKFTKIRTRFSFHRSGIVEMCVVRSKYNFKERYLLSICREGVLKMVGFTEQAVELIKSIDIGRSFNNIVSFGHIFLLIKDSGDMRMFSLKENRKLNIREFDINYRHEKEITTIDVDIKNRLFITASKDNNIKIWNFKKMLLLQIIIS